MTNRDLLTNPVLSQGTVLLSNVLVRPRRSLDGMWRAIPDMYDTGYINLLGERNDRGWFRDFSPRSPSDRVEYNFDESREIAVPGDWNTQHESLYLYAVSYTHLTLPTICSV